MCLAASGMTATVLPCLSRYGMAADWWSVGVMIFEMLGGLPTFRGKDLRQTYQKVLYADVVFTPEENFSPAARELLLGLIHRYKVHTD